MIEEALGAVGSITVPGSIRLSKASYTNDLKGEV